MRQAADLRDGVRSLSVLANNDLHALWRSVSTAVEAKQALADVLPTLIDTYGLAAATLAADWYDEQRAKLDVKGRFTAIPADIRDTGATELAGWAVGSLFQAKPDWQAAQTLVAGGLQRRIANFSRLTVAGSSIADPQAHGWQRVGSGECDFCALLIGRGAVYSEASADFASHDHCNCVAVPAFDGEPRPVKPYTPGPRDRSKAGATDYARAKEWIAKNT